MPDSIAAPRDHGDEAATAFHRPDGCMCSSGLEAAIRRLLFVSDAAVVSVIELPAAVRAIV